MKKIIFAALAAAAIGTASAATYKVDEHHANARFAIDHFNTSTNTGGFYNLSGTVEYNPQAKTGSVKIDIPVANLRSGNEQFDHHLRRRFLRFNRLRRFRPSQAHRQNRHHHSCCQPAKRFATLYRPSEICRYLRCRQIPEHPLRFHQIQLQRQKTALR